MLRSRIIPCLLISKNGLVKTERFLSPKYVGDPINAVKIFNEKKVDELVIFDIDSSRYKKSPDLKKLKIIANESRMPLTYGGGINSVKEAKEIISLGFEKISISNTAIRNSEVIKSISNEIGSQSVVVTIDYKKNLFTKNYNIYTLNGTQRHDYNIFEFAKKVEALGAGEILFNSISRDGTMKGYDIEFAKEIRKIIDTQISFIGGAKDINDMDLLIDSVGIVGAAAGSMFVFKGKFKAVLLNYQKPIRCE
tara:strand:- start:204 stop:956 length:753 start_codon:yes stop_codon:yes gene_type:complete